MALVPVTGLGEKFLHVCSCVHVSNRDREIKMVRIWNRRRAGQTPVETIRP